MIGINICAGFCNRIFQMVFAYAIARRYETQFRFENWENRSHHSFQIYTWLVKRFMDTPWYHLEPVDYEIQYKEPYDKFLTKLDITKEIPDLKKKSVLVEYGFFQNEKYFKEYRSDILELLKEPEMITKYIEEAYLKFLPFIENSYFIHIRLGDYLTNAKHFIDLENYYERCYKKIIEKDPHAQFILFSNEPDKIKYVYPKLINNLYQSQSQYIILNEADETISFYLMKRCSKGGICSNSTFGWWAGWLNTNENKSIFMPSKWIHMDLENDIYPDGTEVVEV